MLVYLNGGPRRYDLRPIPAGRQRRRFWEFQAVLEGRIARMVEDRPPEWHSRTLWLCPPGSTHGWLGARRKTAEIAVFHFQHVPTALEALAPPGNGLAIPLNAAQIRAVRSLLHQGQKHMARPGTGLLLCSDHILSALSLLVYETANRHAAPGPDPDWQRVRQALAWYEARLASNPRFEEVAAAVHVSPSHLRRLFHRCLQTSPQHAFDHLRFQRALQMLTDTDTKLSAIGDACGFSEVAAFSRAFKNKFGTAPSHFRS